MNNESNRININLSVDEAALVSILLINAVGKPQLEKMANSIADALHKGLDEAGFSR